MAQPSDVGARDEDRADRGLALCAQSLVTKADTKRTHRLHHMARAAGVRLRADDAVNGRETSDIDQAQKSSGICFSCGSNEFV